MHLQLTPEMIKEIAQELDMGMMCFYHKTTGQLEVYPDALKHDFDVELWKDTMKKVEENLSDYVEFTGMKSYESFKLMEDFISEITDKRTQIKFEDAIQQRKPFGRFKRLLEYYPDLRTQWFAYRDKRLVEHVEEQVKAYNTPYGYEDEE